MLLHPETAVSIGAQQARPYRPNYAIDGYIDAFHRSLSECPRDGLCIDLGIRGWLRREDALKLYEAAYFAHGDILELGTYCGLSTHILAKALGASGRDGAIVTIELNPDRTSEAEANLSRLGLAERVEFLVGDANLLLGSLAGRRFGMAFIDHSHAYEDVAIACRAMPTLLDPGALCIFHDYNDARNTRARNVGKSGTEYGVFAAVEDALDQSQFAFVGVYGACGVFVRAPARAA